MEFSPGLDTLTKKTIEHRRRGRTVEASVMKTQTNLGWLCHFPPPPPSHLRMRRLVQSHKRWPGDEGKSRRKQWAGCFGALRPFVPWYPFIMRRIRRIYPARLIKFNLTFLVSRWSVC